MCVSSIVSVYMIVSEVSSEGNGTRTEADSKRMGALSVQGKIDRVVIRR